MGAGIAVASQLTTLDSCEAVGTWTAFNISGAVGTLAAIDTTAEEQPPKQGTYCLSFDIDVENGGYYYPISQADYSKKLLYIWICVWTAAGLAVKAPGSGQAGIYIYARDSSGNAGYWHVAGSDTYFGGWRCFVADFSQAPNTNSGTAPNMAQCTGVGFGVNHGSKSKAAHNVFFDFVRTAEVGQGLKVTTSGAVATWADVLSGERVISAGVVRKEGGIYFLQGPIQFGDASTDCQFDDSGQVVVFEDAIVPSTHYRLIAVPYSGGTTEFILGDKSGGRGISGCIVKAQTATSPQFQLLLSGESIDKAQLYGCTIYGASKILFPSYTAYREILSCSFEECGPLEPLNSTVQYSNIIDSDESGVKLRHTEDHHFSDNNFISCPVALELQCSGEITLSNVKFSGNSYDLWENDPNIGAIEVVCSSGTNPVTYSGEVTINAPVIHTLTGLVVESEVTYVRRSDQTVLHHEEDVGVGGEVQYNYTYGGDVDVDILIHHLDYQFMVIQLTLGDSNQTLPVTQVEDPVYSNP